MIFEFIIENAKPKAAPKSADEWVEIGIEWHDRKGTLTAKSFAEEKGIVYGTFTKAMFRYASRIKAALELRELKNKSPKLKTKREQSLQLINDFRASLRKRAADSAAASNKKSLKWFEETVKKAVRGYAAAKPQVGRLYTFAYDAKFKDTLPYWDRFPLVIYLGDGTSKAGNKLMYGLNLHYIPPKARQSFMEELLKNYSNTNRISNKTKLKINWSKVRGMRGSDLMIKSYLPSHLKGTMLEIKPADWHNALLLPSQQFMSQGKRYSAKKVWAKY